jgi:hypothetical protein
MERESAFTHFWQEFAAVEMSSVTQAAKPLSLAWKISTLSGMAELTALS